MSINIPLDGEIRAAGTVRPPYLRLPLSEIEVSDVSDAINDRIEQLEELVNAGVEPSLDAEWNAERERLMRVAERIEQLEAEAAKQDA